MERALLIVFGAAVAADGRPSPALARRIEAAAVLGRSLAAPLYLVTGGRGRQGFVEAEVMRDGLIARGVDSNAILCEAASTDTLGSVVRCARLAAGRADIGPVYVCTSRFHQPRCRILLGLAGLPNARAPMPADRPAMGWSALSLMVLREALAIPYDVAVLTFRGNNPAIWP